MQNFLFIDIPEDRSKTQYSLEYIAKDPQDKETQDNHIIDIEDYKKNLYIYPVSEGINSFKAVNKWCSDNNRNLMIIK